MNNEHQTYPADNEQNDIIIYRSKDGKVNVALMTREGKVWLNQMQIAKLFGTSKQSISHHIAGVLKDNELDKDAVVKYYLTTASDGRNYKVLYYSLEMILAIGYRVRGVRGVQFRQWATQHLSEYLVKGFTMDDERLKNPDGRPDYFDELLQRADETLPNMGLMTWKGSVVRKGDVIIAKNYLVKDEIDKLNRLVMLFLESAELRVKERKDLTLDYWRSNVDALLTFQGQAVLKGNGQVSNGEMEAYAKEVYCRFDERRKKMDAQNADEEDLRFLENLENEIKNKK